MLVAAAEAASAGPHWLTVLTAVFIAAGGVGGFITLLNLPKLRKKMDVDAAEVLTGAAMAIVKPLKDEIDALNARVQRLESERAQHREILNAHAVWDELVAAIVQSAGLNVPPAPPLYPPARIVPDPVPPG